MKKRLVIISYDGVFDFEKNKMVIGGEETYYLRLASLAFSMDWDVVMFLISKSKIKKDAIFDGIKVETIHKKQLCKSLNQSSFDYLYKSKIMKDDVVIIGQENLGIKAPSTRVITIQHGIYHDFPGSMITNFCKRNHILQNLYKIHINLMRIRAFRKDRNLVCVDYNYYNWLRTLTSIYENQEIHVIPNFTSNKLSEYDFEIKQNSISPIKKMIFARRFASNRGSLLFAQIAKRITQERDDVDVTFAGTGPDYTEMLSILGNNPRVHFTSYNAEESIEFHKNFDIAVVPTIFAEGTSLSVLEAMAAGCLPVVTHVGGLTNIIIDNFNGIIAQPTEEDFYKAIVDVLNLPNDKFKYLQRNAYESSTIAFGLELWERKWKKVLLDAVGNNN